MRGYIQIYTGDGKGKTTAALGLILRAAGAGLRVSLIQFLKEGDYSEIKALRQLVPLVHVRQFGSGRFVRGRPTDEDRALADQGLEAAREDLTSGRYDVVILDEINVAGALGMVATEAVLDLLRQRLPQVEVILTGRRAVTAWCQAADLVTEMKAVKHYFQNGVKARVGIEK
jgi:cob(I)alamin adenosyltransferase